MATSKDAPAAEVFMRDYQAWHVKVWGSTPPLGGTRGPNCKVGFSSWSCCEEHRKIKAELYVLEARGAQFYVNSPYAEIGSINWWVALAQETGITIPNMFPYNR